MTRTVAVALAGALIIPGLVATTAVSATSPTPQLAVGGCEVFPNDNPWNTQVSGADAHDDSADMIDALNQLGGNFLHPDFGGNGKYGIPFRTVGPDRTPVKIRFTAFGNESDPGPYPVPLKAPIEGGRKSTGDRHVLTVQRETCRLYELYRAFPQKRRNRWKALRPDCWTSADAAGLPILPGLVHHDEVAAGEIDHALRFTVERTRQAFLRPATHYASDRSGAQWLPMGARLRLRESYDISGFHPDVQIILQALKTYGMIVADNGSNWFITGAADERWDDEVLQELKSVPAGQFEVLEWDDNDLFTEADC
jgi:hypothetical protein